MKTEQSIELLLTPSEAAKALKLSERTLWTMTQRNEVPVVHLGRSPRYPLEALKSWIAEKLAIQNPVCNPTP